MIKALTAYTSEVDDVEAAVSEILEQLNTGRGLLKNSVGILACYADFIGSGVVRDICAALPFDVVGSTTLGNAVPGSKDRIMLSLMVLTSDDVSFSVGLTAPLTREEEEALKFAYDEAASGSIHGKPALILCFAPLLMNVSGDFFADSMSRISGETPLFGMLSVDHNSDYHESRVIHNGMAYADRCAFVLVNGDIEPRFFIGSLAMKMRFGRECVVTESQGNQLHTVNNIPVTDYLLSLGLKKNDDGTISGINAFPFIVDYNDGSATVVRSAFATTPEGYAVCGGNLPEGVTMTVGSLDADDVLETTAEAVSSAISAKRPECLIIFSCVGRYYTMGYDPMSEIEKIQSILDGTDIPYYVAYSGSELCPVSGPNSGNSTVNRNHNDTIVICRL
ncbi:MAG: FIST C-terminal domain-containing protein [Synergistaceae bacterium]|nr:FIST C-terminal domain-containing protein [Synergistaceae bacterium]